MQLTTELKPACGQRDALSAIRRCLTERAPLLGIPRPGQPAFVIKRAMLALCVKDAEITHAELNGTLNIKVKRAHGHGVYKLMPVVTENRYEFTTKIQELNQRWARQQRGKGQLSGSQRGQMGKFAVRIRDTKAAIAKIEDRLAGQCHRYDDRLTTPTVPRHPLLPHYSSRDFSPADRRDALLWHLQKTQRQAISKLRAIHFSAALAEFKLRQAAGEGEIINMSAREYKRYIHAQPSLSKLYAALRAAGFKVRRHSDIGGQSKPEFTAYLKRLPEFCGLLVKPHTVRFDGYAQDRVRMTSEVLSGLKAHRGAYVQQLRARQNAQQELTMLRELLASYQQQAADEHKESEDENVGT